MQNDLIWPALFVFWPALFVLYSEQFYFLFTAYTLLDSGSVASNLDVDLKIILTSIVFICLHLTEPDFVQLRPNLSCFVLESTNSWRLNIRALTSKRGNKGIIRELLSLDFSD